MPTPEQANSYGPPAFKASAQWGKGVKYAADTVIVGERVRIVLEGRMTGHRVDETGCSVELKPESVRLEPIASSTENSVRKLRERLSGDPEK